MPDLIEELVSRYHVGIANMELGRQIQADASAENREVVAQLRRVLSVPEIAEKLGVSRTSVYRHLERYAKGDAE